VRRQTRGVLTEHAAQVCVVIPVRVGTDSLVTWRDAEPSGAVAA
jgi:hypothetical protein